MTRLNSLSPMLQKAIALFILAGLVLAINAFIVQPLFSTQTAQLESANNSTASFERIAALSTNAPLIRENVRDILQDKGCYSRVGRTGGGQVLSLGEQRACIVAVIKLSGCTGN